jgi:ethanolamine kinase
LNSRQLALQNDEISLMRLFAHNHLGPRVYASFENGLAFEYIAGKCLDYVLAVDKNVYPLVAKKVGTLHRLMSSYVGKFAKFIKFINLITS